MQSKDVYEAVRVLSRMAEDLKQKTHVVSRLADELKQKVADISVTDKTNYEVPRSPDILENSTDSCGEMFAADSDDGMLAADSGDET